MRARVRSSRRPAWALAAACVLGLAACGEPQPYAPPPAPRRAVPEVWTTFYPTTYVAQRLGGPEVKVVCPLPAEADPAFWRPDTATLAGYQAADLIVINGAGFEHWVVEASLPPSRVVDTSQGFADTFIQLEGGVTHSHGTGGTHTHEGIDGHTWFDPLNLKAQAEAIRKALARRLPAAQATWDARYAALAQDLDALDAAFRALGSLPAGQHLYASHPAWNYAARRYGWGTVTWHLDPGEMPSDADLAAIKARLVEKPSRVMLWEETPLPAIAERFAKELGLTSIAVPPCESESPEDRAAGRDYLARMRANVEALRPAFQAR